ncbi:MAG: efflux transporter outer membrane subunit [Syntrophobacteraceae bacterium]
MRQVEINRGQNIKASGIGILCLWGMFILMTAGCTVGPDFLKPKTSLPSAWKGVDTPASFQTSRTVSEPITLIQWWKGFGDQTLTSLIDRGVQSNLDVRQAGARIRQARAARGVGFAALWPTIDASGSYRRISSGGGASGGTVTPGATSGGGATERDLFQVGLDSAWELDFFGGTRRNVEALSADVSAAEEDRHDVLVSLIAEIGVNYISLRGLQKQIAIAEENLAAQQHTAEITRQRYEAGFVSALDVANANAQAAATASQIPVLKSSVQETIYNLSVLLGREPTSLVQELSTEAPIPLTPPEVPVGLPSDLIRRRPDIRRAEAQLHAATARIGVATADLFPKFSLTGSLGFSSSDLAAVFTPATRNWSIGPSVGWRIFDAGSVRSNIEVRKALEEQSIYQYEKAILTALKDVETSLTAYAREQEHRKLLEEAVIQNRRAVELSKTLYTEGQTDFLNVLSAQRSLYISEEALVISIRTLSTDLIALYKALGGGWEEEHKS